MKLLVVLACVLLVVFAKEEGKETLREGEYIMDIPKGLEFIEEEFVEPLAEMDVKDDIGSLEEPVEMLSAADLKELENSLADIDVEVPVTESKKK